MVRRTGWAFELKHHLCFNPLPWRLSASPLPAPIDNGMSVIWKWEILASSHFEISYSSILAETAEKIAQYFEQIRKKNKNKKNGIRRF